MFQITSDAQDLCDEDDGPMTTFDDTPIPVDNEVYQVFYSFRRKTKEIFVLFI